MSFGGCYLHARSACHECSYGLGQLGHVAWSPDYGTTKLPADWMPSMASRVREVPAPALVEDEQRLREGMQALARFMTWVDLEAHAQWGARQFGKGVDAERTFVLRYAIEIGQLRLEWP